MLRRQQTTFALYVYAQTNLNTRLQTSSISLKIQILHISTLRLMVYRSCFHALRDGLHYYTRTQQELGIGSEAVNE